MKKILASIALIAATALSAIAQNVLPSKEVEKKIAAWYELHPKEYKIELKDMKVKAEIAGYYENGPRDLIRVNWQGMRLEFAFSKDIKDISAHPDSLKKYFRYASASHIYMEIDAPHWDVHPGTSMSSYEKGVKFIDKGNGHFAVEIKWDIYGVMGYKQDEWCKEAMEITDTATPEKCMAHQRKKIDFILELDVAIDAFKK